MRQLQGSWRTIALAGLLAAVGAAQARNQPQTNDDSTVAPAVKARQASEIRRGDPARWHKGDPTRQARLQTLQKEIGAAYAEAKKACGQNPAAERSACMKEARTTYEQDMKNAPAQLDEAPAGSVQTTVQTSTPASR
jgi:hypothetical protein